MNGMNMGRRAYVIGAWVAAAVILLLPAAAAAADTPTVRVTRPAAGRAVLEVADDTVAVRKELTADQSVVTLTTERDRLSIAVRRGVVTISGPGGALTVGAGKGVDTDRLLTVLQRSEAARRARVLLEQLSEGPNTFVGQSMLLTRAILELGTGSVDALNRHQQWVAERAAQMAVPSRSQGRPMVFRAAFLEAPQSGPGDCWDAYQKEALRIAADFEDCTDDLYWYEAHKWAGCSLIYAVRAEGAMAWFISCNGGVPFNG
jgi:hypothetical protein